jgi:hypothetical protein
MSTRRSRSVPNELRGRHPTIEAHSDVDASLISPTACDLRPARWSGRSRRRRSRIWRPIALGRTPSTSCSPSSRRLLPWSRSFTERLLAEEACEARVRTVQRAVAPVRQAQRAADLATVRVETAPGAQLQIDFGEKRVEIAGSRSTVSVRQMACAPARRIVTICSSVSRVSSWAPAPVGCAADGGAPLLTAGPLEWLVGVHSSPSRRLPEGHLKNSTVSVVRFTVAFRPACIHARD